MQCVLPFASLAPHPREGGLVSHSEASRTVERGAFVFDEDAELVNGTRFWACAESRTLYGENVLAVTWGRIDAPKRTKLYTFDTWRELHVARRRMLRTRWRHGYVTAARS